jgi:hypothetical protein
MNLIDRIVENITPLSMLETVRYTNSDMIILFRLQLEVHVTNIHGCLHRFNPLPPTKPRRLTRLLHSIEDALLLL